MNTSTYYLYTQRGWHTSELASQCPFDHPSLRRETSALAGRTEYVSKILLCVFLIKFVYIFNFCLKSDKYILCAELHTCLIFHCLRDKVEEMRQIAVLRVSTRKAVGPVSPKKQLTI